MDDTFVIQKAEHSQQFLHIINTQHGNIHFTVEEPDQDGALPIQDSKVTPGPNITLQTGNQHTLINTYIVTATTS